MQMEQPRTTLDGLKSRERCSSLSSRSSEIDREMTDYNRELVSPAKKKPAQPGVASSPPIDIRLSLAALSSKFNESIQKDSKYGSFSQQDI